MHVEGAGSVEIENGQGHTFTLGAWRKRLRCWRLWLPYVSAPAEQPPALLAPVAPLHESLAYERPHRTQTSIGCMPEARALLALVAGVQERPAAKKVVTVFARNKTNLSICAHEVPHNHILPCWWPLVFR